MPSTSLYEGIRVPRVGLFDGELEWPQKILANHPLGVVAWPDVRARFRLAVHGKVLRGREHVCLVDERAVALKAGDGRHPDA